jgi:hypothetical protein
MAAQSARQRRTNGRSTHKPALRLRKQGQPVPSQRDEGVTRPVLLHGACQVDASHAEEIRLEDAASSPPHLDFERADHFQANAVPEAIVRVPADMRIPRRRRWPVTAGTLIALGLLGGLVLSLTLR